ncbi:hypothetical protein E2C01_080587 [Portunus trituberculatus]|uniref:Uncharacterized protein n=1 Tax=Portunus trituberculatus TaxID=210409 RepID=A0A5B7IPL4_PORTR|nr:hypothetical protein [Portunus trituberculatus]
MCRCREHRLAPTHQLPFVTSSCIPVFPGGARETPCAPQILLQPHGISPSEPPQHLTQMVAPDEAHLVHRLP